MGRYRIETKGRVEYSIKSLTVREVVKQIYGVYCRVAKKTEGGYHNTKVIDEKTEEVKG